ncbi:MAG: hypothetical protein QHH10_06805 [Peptococcaceae bacterium]|jgi:hypothetical protein|nr:hypothetical protein [Peptococcaceae bacterium]MDH7525009.1 hypothetical protein [Peptococcaceae bacterium]
MKKTLAILLTLILILCSSTATLAKPHGVIHSVPAKSTYTFSYEVPGYIVTEKDTAVNVTFKTALLGSAGYEGVHFEFQATNNVAGTVYFTATDSAGNTQTFINNGSWGPAEGFTLPAYYNESTSWNLKFTKAGQYNIIFKAFSGSNVFAEKIQSLTVTDAAFVYTVPETVYANQEITVNVGFVTEQDYSNVHFEFSKTAGPGNVVFKAKDSNEVWFNFINAGTWGSGFNITSPYSTTTPWLMTFSLPGTYTITYKLVESDNDIVATGSTNVVVKDPTAVNNDDEDDDSIKNGNTKGLLNALRNHYKKNKKINHGAERIVELLMARGVNQVE